MLVMADVMDSSETRGQLAELLVEILDRCGVYSSDEEEKPIWIQLSASLEKLTAHLQKLRSKRGEPNSDATDVYIQLEEEAGLAREQCKILFQENKDISPVLLLCQEAQESCRKQTEFHAIFPLFLSLRQGISKQALDITEMIRRTEESLTMLYQVENDSKVLDCLAEAVDRFYSRCINPNAEPWREARDVARALLSGDSDDLPLIRHPERKMVLGESNAISVEAPVSNAPPLSQDSVVDAALSFANSDDDHNRGGCFLLVGPPGSGKTYCFDEIERLAPAEVMGE